ncbi:MAG TPA: hypothetical protein VGG28_13440 [Kofleriaceae bacterium]|jgi:hypothetical protein
MIEALEIRNVAVLIARSPDDVYAFARDGASLPAQPGKTDRAFADDAATVER